MYDIVLWTIISTQYFFMKYKNRSFKICFFWHWYFSFCLVDVQPISPLNQNIYKNTYYPSFYNMFHYFSPEEEVPKDILNICTNYPTLSVYSYYKLFT